MVTTGQTRDPVWVMMIYKLVDLIKMEIQIHWSRGVDQTRTDQLFVQTTNQALSLLIVEYICVCVCVLLIEIENY